MDFDTAYARSGIGRSIYDPDWGQEDPEFDNPMSLDSLMDDEKENPVMDFDALARELIAKEVENLRLSVKFHETDREYNVNRIRSLTEELDEVRRDRDWYRSRVDVLQLELDRHTRAEMDLRARERAAELEQRSQQVLQSQPEDLLPKMKGMTKARRKKLVAETAERIKADGPIPAIKWIREQLFEQSGSQFGLKQAKDFVDCIRAHEEVR
jgi:hypothetical protein